VTEGAGVTEQLERAARECDPALGEQALDPSAQTDPGSSVARRGYPETVGVMDRHRRASVMTEAAHPTVEVREHVDIDEHMERADREPMQARPVPTVPDMRAGEGGVSHHVLAHPGHATSW
jgi:hypothetical protein